MDSMGRTNLNSKGDTTYEQYLDERSKESVFNKDMIELEYKFWESPEERVERLKRIWIDLKKNNALGGIEQRTTQEQIELNKKIVELMRRLRIRVD
jgi:hypothetical protein